MVLVPRPNTEQEQVSATHVASTVRQGGADGRAGPAVSARAGRRRSGRCRGRGPVRLTATWGLGAILSGVLLWAVSAVFLDSTPKYQWCSRLGRDIPVPGSQVTWRSEGWATTRYGAWGLTSHIGPKAPDVVFWGDSYVEAYQVADTRKMAGALTTLCRSRPGGQALTAGSAGRSGQSLADYILQIPAYERAAGVPRLHVVILADIEDLLPDQGSAHHARFLSQPDFRLAGDRPMSGFERAARTVLADWHLQVLDTLESRFLGVLAKKPLWRRLRFRPGPVDRALAAAGPEPAAGAVTTPEATAAIDYILKELRQATAAPVLLVYCPTVPHLVNGAAVFGDAQAAAFQVVETRAGLARVPLITMGGAFAEHFRATRRLPRGFANSRVGEGHLNEDGHRLVAVAVLDHLNRSSSPP